MINDSSQEKRLLKRYLCDDFFTLSALLPTETSLDLTAINFNKEGIGVFSNDFIPESGSLSLSIRYDSPRFSHTFNKLPCAIVYSNQTEVGSHCGVRFNLDDISQTDKEALELIEAYLVKIDNPDNRYNIFGDD